MKIKRLPGTEFELMKIIWRNQWKDEPPMTTNAIMAQLPSDNNWKPQTVLTMLIRLMEKGFLTSSRIGRERNYRPLISEEDYMDVETGEFIARYRGNSVGSLVKTMYDGKSLSQRDIKELKKWLKSKEEG